MGASKAWVFVLLPKMVPSPALPQILVWGFLFSDWSRKPIPNCVPKSCPLHKASAKAKMTSPCDPLANPNTSNKCNGGAQKHYPHQIFVCRPTSPILVPVCSPSGLQTFAKTFESNWYLRPWVLFGPQTSSTCLHVTSKRSLWDSKVTVEDPQAAHYEPIWRPFELDVKF